jgi:hypothetical protein
MLGPAPTRRLRRGVAVKVSPAGGRWLGGVAQHSIERSSTHSAGTAATVSTALPTRLRQLLQRMLRPSLHARAVWARLLRGARELGTAHR